MCDFDVGFVSGNSVISTRNPGDLAEVWSDIKRGRKVVLWCDGLKTKLASVSTNSAPSNRQRRSRESEGDETDEESDDLCARFQKKLSAKEAREEKLQSTIEKLKEKHGTLFTPMQIQI